MPHAPRPSWWFVLSSLHRLTEFFFFPLDLDWLPKLCQIFPFIVYVLLHVDLLPILFIIFPTASPCLVSDWLITTIYVFSIF